MENSTYVAVQNEINQIEIYDLSSKKFVGYVPSYNTSLLTTFLQLFLVEV